MNIVLYRFLFNRAINIYFMVFNDMYKGNCCDFLCSLTYVGLVVGVIEVNKVLAKMKFIVLVSI